MSVFVVLYEVIKKLIPSETTVLYCPSPIWLAGLRTLTLLKTLLVQTRHTKKMSFDSTSLLHGQKVDIYLEDFP